MDASDCDGNCDIAHFPSLPSRVSIPLIDLEEHLPELPEVETVRRGLLPAMEGRTFKKVDQRRPDLRWPLPENMVSRLTGSRVGALRRRSKYLLIDLSTNETLIIHLGMSGRILISGDPLGRHFHEYPATDKHDHVIFYMDNGCRISFNDARRFGAMDLCRSDQLDQHKMLRELGPEPLSNAFNESYLAGKLKGRTMPMKAALLDQKIVAGLGNIYVCEALHRSGISPRRKAGNLGRDGIARVVPVIRDVLNEAIEAGGSSLKDYRQTDGELGYFQHSFGAYDKQGSPCPKPNCGGKISRIVQSGRSTFFCSSCQR